MGKTRIEIYTDADNYFKLLVYAQKNNQNMSVAVNDILKKHFLGEDTQQLAVDRLNKVIQAQEEKIRNLQHELTHSVDQQIQDLKAATVLKGV